MIHDQQEFSTMSVTTPLRLALAGLAAMLMLVFTPSARAQQQPSANSLAMANEILDIKGSMNLFAPLIPGVVEQSKNSLLQMNPNMFKDLTEVADSLRKEYAPRLTTLRQNIVAIYASRFTEQELKDTLTFYKSPVGKKLLSEEPAFVERSMTAAQDWAVKLNEEALQRFRVEMKKRGHAL
jgi:hypothetical protein